MEAKIMSKKFDITNISVFNLIMLLVASCIPLFFYVWEFRENTLGDPKDFANFGSFAGGTVGALIQGLNVFLLIIIYQRQTLEHRETIQQQYVAFVAPIVKVEICETEKSLNDIRLKSLGFNSPQNNRPPFPLATLNEFLKKPDLIDEISGEEIYKVITSLSDYVDKIYYMAEMIRDLYQNKSPHFVYIGYIKKLGTYSHHILALNNRDKRDSTSLLCDSIVEKMTFINEVRRIS